MFEGSFVKFFWLENFDLRYERGLREIAATILGLNVSSDLACMLICRLPLALGIKFMLLLMLVRGRKEVDLASREVLSIVE